MVLEPGQSVYAKVMFDGVDPIDLPEEEEREKARELFGPVERVPQAARRVAASIIGGRAGKTYLASLRLLHLCCTVDLEGVLAPGQRAHAAIVAPDTKTAQEGLTYFVGACACAPRLQGCVEAEVIEKVMEQGKAVESFVFRRPVDGLFVEVSVYAVRQGGANIRGRWLVGVLMDEACLFYSDGYKVTDKGVYDAVWPRLVKGGRPEGGQLILSSTPWLDVGVLYTLWNTQWGEPRTALVAHAPTLALRSDPDIVNLVTLALAAPGEEGENARREFGAEFGTGAPDDWFDKAELKAACCAESLPEPRPGETVGAGGDLGFVKNSSCEVVSADDGRQVRVCVVKEWRPGVGGRRLRPSKVCGEIAADLRRLGARSIVADGHYRETLREHLEPEPEEGAEDGGDEFSSLILESPPGAEEAFALVRLLLSEGRLRLPGGTEAEQLLVKQFEGVKRRRVAKGKVQLILPQSRDGRHGDLAAAAALAIWAVVRRPHRIPVPQSSEQRERAERLARWREGRQREREQEEAGVWYE